MNVSKILLQFVLFYDTLTVYAENKRKGQNLQILVFTGVGLLDDWFASLQIQKLRRWKGMTNDHSIYVCGNISLG